MAVPVSELLELHSQNEANHTGLRTGTDKTWAQRFHPITNLLVHTTSSRPVLATWDAFIPLCGDDIVRMRTLAHPPNERKWRLATEGDMAAWFHAEVSNIVLPAWSRTPSVLQRSEQKPLDETQDIPEAIDVIYTLALPAFQGRVLAIGEFKRNLIKAKPWQKGDLGDKPSHQINLSRELRGYAFKYNCPHVFCFDGEVLLLLQFRAESKDHMKKEDCAVDCWVLHRENEGGTTLRDGLYRLLCQGFRRCQGLSAFNQPIYGAAIYKREFFSGRPIFHDRRRGQTYQHPQDTEEAMFDRDIDCNDGSVYWIYNQQPLVCDGVLVQDSAAMWDPNAPVESALMTWEETVAGPSQ